MFDVISLSEDQRGPNAKKAPRELVRLPRDADLERAHGSARLVLALRNGITCPVEIFQKSPLRVLFPRPHGGERNEAVFANTAGGIAGGDRYASEVDAGEGSIMAVTSQAAEKVYRALDTPARISTRLRAGVGAKLAWLPQEMIVFNGARLVRSMEVDLTPGAELMALEWLVLGRAARGETMREGTISDRWRVRLEGRLLWADCFRLDPGVWPHVRQSSLLDGCIALATIVYFGPRVAHLCRLRESLGSFSCAWGTTQVAGLALARFAAREASELRKALLSFLQEFSTADADDPFRVPKMWSC